MFSVGIMAIVGVVSHIFFISVTWYVLQVIKIDPLVRKGREMEVKILMLFLTIAIGTTVSNFFLDILQWSQDLTYLL